MLDDEFSPFYALSLDLLCIADSNGYFTRLSPAWESCLGWTLEELQARPFIDFVHEGDREATLREVRELARGASAIAFENRYLGKDGRYRWLQWNAKVQLESQRIYASARDITDAKRMEREVLEASDREKERVGQELHDGLCQNLAGIAALSATLSIKLARANLPAADDATEITKLLNENIGYAHNLAQALNPVGLVQNGLVETLDAFAANVESLFQVSCTFQCNSPWPRFDSAAEVHLYRIAQQAVSNAVTHGRGTRIQIGLRSRGARGRLSIVCNGAGFSNNIREQDGLGMHTMDYRAHLIGASLRVARLTPHGVAVICGFPLPPVPPTDRRHARRTT